MKIGVVMPVGPVQGGNPRPYAKLSRLARATEESDLDSIWVFDHLLYRFPDRPQAGPHEAWTILSALAAETSRVEIGPLVLAMPFRNPALLAKMAATLQEVSGGRLILGVGAGWHEPEFEAFGYPFDHRVSRFEEGLTILTGLLRGDSVSLDGSYQHADDAILLPPPPSRIPLLMAGRRPRMMRLIARHADAFNCAWLGPIAGLEPRIAPLRAACEEVGRAFASIELTVGLNVTFPALLTGEASTEEPPAISLSGSAAHVADGLHDYLAAGVGHVMVSLTPPTPDAVHELSRAAALLRL
jgi:probable F420-dependent oxidoreductase